MAFPTRVVTKAQAAQWGYEILCDMKLTGLTRTVNITDPIAQEIIKIYARQFESRDQILDLMKQQYLITHTKADISECSPEEKLKIERLENQRQAILQSTSSWEQDFDGVQKKHFVSCGPVSQEAILRARALGE